MKIYNKKNHLHRIIIFFTMLLFAACLTMNVFFCSNYNLYELLDGTAVIDTWTISESIVANESGDNTDYFKSSFSYKDASRTEAITKKICLIPMIAAVPKGFSLLLFPVIIFLFFFLTIFISLPNKWTLVNQKIRLDI